MAQKNELRQKYNTYYYLQGSKISTFSGAISKEVSIEEGSPVLADLLQFCRATRATLLSHWHSVLMLSSRKIVI